LAKTGLAKALERKMGLDEGILTKIKTKDVESTLLMNPARQRIFQHVCNYPASHLRKISRDLDFSTQTAKWHLVKLTEGGLISSYKIGKKHVFVQLKDIITITEAQVLSLLHDNETKQIIHFIDENPEPTQKEMEESLGIYQQKLSRILTSLEKHDIVAYEKRGREKVYSLTALLKDLRSSFDNRFNTFQTLLLSALRGDGVAPKIKGSTLRILSVEIDMGGNKKAVLKIQKNPLRNLLKQ
jgi:DNA-binding MarR family transcriptional regulator